jgi:glycosyltransferase involved in cell wall biosynthesis
MRILLSAFACEPHKGSEAGVGWHWAVTLARHHDVTVVTDTMHQAAVEQELARHGDQHPRLRVLFFRPGFLRDLKVSSSTIYTLYSSWQILALPLFRRLHREQPFDLALHLTYGVFRQPSLLPLTGIPTAIGPIGGAEDVPLRLKASIHGKEKLLEIVRTLANRVAAFDPLLWLSLSRARWVFTKTEQTRQALPRFARRKAVVLPEIGIDRVVDQIGRRGDGEPLHLLFAGRLLGWKGAHLALRGVAEARRQGCAVRLTLVGQGRYEPALRELATRCGLDDGTVEWIAQLPQPALFARMRQAHALLFPSLHDSSGNVVLEAQAQGLPVICLDCGGPATLVTPQSALLIATAGRGEDAVVTDIARAIGHLAADEAARRRMAEAALHNAGTSSWQQRVDHYLSVIQAR